MMGTREAVGMAMRVEFRSVFLATRRGREPARLVTADGRIVCILVPISPEDNEDETEGWYLEVGFGPCEAEALLFASLEAAETWVREQVAKFSGEQAASPDDGGVEPGTAQPSGEGAAPVAALRILIVEDDAIQALGLESLVASLGHQVVDMVASAPAAVAAAEQHRPDLVFMDVRLAEGTNGIDAATEIRNRLGIPSIFMTAHADVQTRSRIAQIRSTELLPKPVSAAAVRAALNRASQLLSGSARPLG